MSPNVNPELPAGSLGGQDMPGIRPPSEPVWNSRTQWGAMTAGAFAGVVVVILMATLGLALGITTSAIAITNTESATPETAEKAATAYTVGAVIWFLLTAVISGLVGGWVLNATARRDRPYSSFIFGSLSWALGLCILMVVAAPGIGGALSGLGSAAGGAAAGIGARPEILGKMLPSTEAPGTPSARSETPQARQPMTDEQKAAAKDAAEKATAASTGAAWVVFGSMLISITSTVLAASWKRHTGTRVVTELRPRPSPSL